MLPSMLSGVSAGAAGSSLLPSKRRNFRQAGQTLALSRIVSRQCGHAEWSIRALDAGKHVLCEKPLATSGQEARAMFDAAKRNDRRLAEAYPYRAQPQTLKLGDLLRQNAIGRVQLIQASFGFPLADAANIRMNPALAGGALMDAGCYPVSFVRMVAGSRPARVQALAQWSDSGVDRTLVASLEFASGLIAQISCTFATARHRRAESERAADVHAVG